MTRYSFPGAKEHSLIDPTILNVSREPDRSGKVYKSFWRSIASIKPLSASRSPTPWIIQCSGCVCRYVLRKTARCAHKVPHAKVRDPAVKFRPIVGWT